MNGESNRILHTSALDAAALDARPYTRMLFAAQLWLLAAFVGMSLVAIAAKLLLGGDGAHAAAFALVGAVLVPLAWRNVARLLARAEREFDPGARTVPAADAAPLPQQLLLAPHR